MSRFIAVFAGIASFALMFAPASATAVPQGLHLQGYLGTEAGVGASGTYDVTVRLFESQSSTEELWSHQFSDVAVDAGLFDVTLDATAVAVFTSSPSAWLETQVDDEAPLPRRPVLSVAYAISAGQADVAKVAQGLACGDCVKSEHIAPGAVGAGQLAPGAVTVGTLSFDYAASNEPAGAATGVECDRCVGDGDLAMGLALQGNVSSAGSLTACVPGFPGCALGVGGAGGLLDKGDGAITIQSTTGLRVRGATGSTWGGIEVGDAVVHGTLTVADIDCVGCIGPEDLSSAVGGGLWSAGDGGDISYMGGNVGIATDAPGVELEVAGTVKAERFEGLLGSPAGDVDMAVVVALVKSKNLDLDGDGLVNGLEAAGDSDGDGELDIFDPDSDNDGITDGDDDDPTDPGVAYFPVTGFQATIDPADPTTVNLSWAKSKSAGATRTVIRRKTGSAPTTPSDGAAVADTTGTSAVDPGLGPDDYFYAAFAGDDAGIFSKAAVLGPVTVTHINPVMDAQVLASTGGEVELAWAPSTSPGFAHTLIVRKQGGFPTGPSDGVVVTTTSSGVATYTDGSVTPWETWHYALFATNAVESAFSDPANAGTGGVFVDGQKTCGDGEVLVGVDGSGGILCAPFEVTHSLDCVEATQGGGAPGTPVTASCPAGYTAMGGGFTDIDQNGGGSSGDEFTLEPDGNGWKVRFEDEVGGFDARAVCCKLQTDSAVDAQPGGCGDGEAIVGLVGATGPDDGLDCGPFAAAGGLMCQNVTQAGGAIGTPVTATCPTGSTVVGGGFVDLDQNGNGSSGDELTSTADGNGWKVRFEDEVGGFQAVARCCEASVTGSSGAPVAVTNVVGTETCSEAGSLTGGWIGGNTSWTHTFAPFQGQVLSATLTVDIGDADGGTLALVGDGVSLGSITGGDNGGPGAWKCPGSWGGGKDNKITLPASVYSQLLDGSLTIQGTGSGLGTWGTNRAILELTYVPGEPGGVVKDVVGTETCSEGQSLTGGWTSGNRSWSHSFGAIPGNIVSATLTIDIGDADGGTLTLVGDGHALGSITGGDNGGPGAWKCPNAWGGGKETVLTLPSSVYGDLLDGTLNIVGTQSGLGTWGTNRAILEITWAPTSSGGGTVKDVVGTEVCSAGASLTGGWISGNKSWTHSYAPITGSVVSATLTVDIGDADGGTLTLNGDGVALGSITGGDNGGPGTWRCPDAWGGGKDTKLVLPASVYDKLLDGTFTVSGTQSGLGTWGTNRAILEITYVQGKGGAVSDVVGTETCTEGQSLTGGWIGGAASWTHTYAPVEGKISSATLRVDIGDADGASLTLVTSNGVTIGVIGGGDNGGPGTWRCPDAWVGGADHLLSIPAAAFDDLADGSLTINTTNDTGVGTWGINRAILDIQYVGGCPTGEAPIGVESIPGGGYELVCGAVTGLSASLDCQPVTASGGAIGNPVTAVCPSDRFLTGGGFVDIDQNGGGSSGDEFTSRPNGNGWYVRFEDEVGGFDATAMCCKVVAE